MAKFVELNEAAKMLGVSPDDLVEMRSNGEIHGYRDGASWKFKEEEVERILADRGGAADSELVSEEALGHSGDSTSSTIIGQGEAEPADSDLSLGADAGSDLVLGGDEAGGVDSDVHLVPSAAGDSDVSLVPDPGSDRELRPGAADALGGSDLSLDSPAGTGDMELDAPADTGGLGSGDMDLSLDSELALSDDDEIVLSGSGSGSDLSLSAADSGINLSSPSDSGLSLEADSGISLQTPTDSGLSLEEDAIDMGGSSISSLELPEDEEVMSIEDAGGQPEDQFRLSPSDEIFTDESDSGSQVIALEDSEAFEQPGVPGGQPLLEQAAELREQISLVPGSPVSVGPAGPVSYELPEAPYTVWTLMGLGTILLFLCLTGILMTDVVRNMWAWEEGRDVTTSISEGITTAVGLKP